MSKLKLGMVGGGQGAFIGGVHRMAARLDGDWELVAGALSSDPERARASANDLGIAPDRSYADFNVMAEAEAARADGIDAVAIVTPNHMHAAPAIAFLERGIHVICDKPLASTQEEAKAIVAAAEVSEARVILTHNYSGYPMIRQAREMVARGDLGKVRFVAVEYVQDWLAAEPAHDNKQAAWRVDPAKAGGGAIGDIGTHAYHLAGFVSGLRCERLAADLSSFVDGRAVDDNAEVLLRYEGGAKGLLLASQVGIGHENSLRLRVFGEAGGLEWSHEEPDLLRFTKLGAPTCLLTRNGAGATADNSAASRVPAGHPEGYLEAFANLYRESAALIRDPEKASKLPDLDDGLAGMRFIAGCQKSAEQNCAWIDIAAL
ncbi:Gfo/Idh/MocA family protein [Marinobacterium rhizophilum]|uniref:Gfo/Idh/MocA family protein n=1 Tax=Marinobacterium rhizophilum TaxID=420402 RepID=UPI000371BED3|nr:Gfo/Idh/MocA family oxidoreductase [Marinobacterium rhizophilum]